MFCKHSVLIFRIRSSRGRPCDPTRVPQEDPPNIMKSIILFRVVDHASVSIVRWF